MVRPRSERDRNLQLNPNDAFTEEQKEYLAGFTTGAGLVAGSTGVGVPVTTTVAAVEPQRGPDGLLYHAHQRVKDSAGTLVAEEIAKGEKHPLDRWDELVERAEQERYPSGVDVFLSKSFGIFYVAPAQNSYMCRLRFAGGSLTSHQLAGVAEIADRCAGGYAHITTRANLQLREIPATKPPEVLSALFDLGIITRGSGADNIRNITASPTAGFDCQEMVNTLPLAKKMQQYILNQREMYHLPRKFNIAFDGGGVISTLADTNDIGFQVVRVSEANATTDTPAGTYFRVQLAGITGHHQFASDCGWLIGVEQCIGVAAAMIRVFIKNGNRTDRKKARLKYLIDEWGLEKFLETVCEEMAFRPTEFPLERCDMPLPAINGSHIGFHPARDDKYYVGIVIPVGFMTSANMRDLASIASAYGDSQLRLTCWQNVLIPGIAAADIDAVKQAIERAGLSWNAHSIRAGLVACTGNSGCKFAASDTKRHAMEIAAYIEENIEMDMPINIHLTGCHHSCAQHYIGDIGLIASKVEIPTFSIRGIADSAQEATGAENESEEVEGYHIFIGGGFGERQGLGRELLRDVPAFEVPQVLAKIVNSYQQQRYASEAFCEFTRRHEIEALRQIFGLVSAESNSLPANA